MLRYQLGWTYRELGALFGLDVNTIRRLLATREAEIYHALTVFAGTNGYRKPSLIGEVGYV